MRARQVIRSALPGARRVRCPHREVEHRDSTDERDKPAKQHSIQSSKRAIEALIEVEHNADHAHINHLRDRACTHSPLTHSTNTGRVQRAFAGLSALLPPPIGVPVAQRKARRYSIGVYRRSQTLFSVLSNALIRSFAE